MQVTVFILLFALTIPLSGCLWNETNAPDAFHGNSAYLPLDDSEYPFADIPRLVIETENFSQIRNRTEKISALAQIYGKDAPESEIYELTVRGRGNSTFHGAKYGIKLEFTNKVTPFGMPKNRDWILRPCYGDKTLLRDYMIYRLGEWLGARFTPKMHYVEFYFNREYKGLYLFMESVKVAKNRVNIPQTENSFLFEKEDSNKIDDPFFETLDGNLIHIKFPKNPSTTQISRAKSHLDSLEEYLHRGFFWNDDSITNWIDIDDFLSYYWIQEFSKNEDGKFTRSVYFSWTEGGSIHFGPLWDFDLSFGNESREQFSTPEYWFIRNYRWNKFILQDYNMNELVNKYWKSHREIFHALIDSIPLYKKQIEKAVANNFKRWPILNNTFTWALRHSYDSYDEAVDSMIVWATRRFDWIDSNL